MSSGGRYRRAVLRTAAVCGTGMLGGCLQELPFVSGGNQPPERFDPTPVYRRWVPAGFDGLVMYTVPGAAGPDGDVTLGRGAIWPSLDAIGLDVETFTGIVGLGLYGSVLLGTYDRATVEEFLLEHGYAATDTYQGYQVFEWQPGTADRIALSPESVVISTDHLRTLIDTGEGREPRLHETDENFAELTDHLGTYPFMVLWREGDRWESDRIAYGAVYASPQGNETRLAAAYRLESAGTQPRDELRNRHENGSITVENRFATVYEGTGDHDYNREDPVPITTVGATRTEEQVVLHHVAGDPIPLGDIHLSPPSSERVTADLQNLRSFQQGDRLVVDSTGLEDSHLTLSYTGFSDVTAGLYRNPVRVTESA